MHINTPSINTNYFYNYYHDYQYYYSIIFTTSDTK